MGPLGFFSQEDQAELLEAAGLDPEALAALPPEMRREVLEQVCLRRRLLRLPGGRAEQVEYRAIFRYCCSLDLFISSSSII